jgi:UDP-galactopyranose mutase
VQIRYRFFMEILITGTGLSGASAAAILSQAAHELQVYDTRPHVGGNCHDELQQDVTVHKYGPHIFHTDSAMVWNFLSRFTEWNNYRHRVLADTALGRIPIPWSTASAAVVGRELSDAEVQKLIFVDYSEKMWGVPFAALPDAIRNRVPLRRAAGDTRYFTDRYQGQPKQGFSTMFARMLEGIPVHTGADENAWQKEAKKADLHIYTGKIDAYFSYCYGRLPYRSLRFEHERSKQRQVATSINQCNTLPWTRVTDHAWFLNENPAETVLTKEFPMAHDETNEAFYPMPFGEGRELYARYRLLAKAEPRTIFLGRLATYCYLDMWMAVAQALTALKELMRPEDRMAFFERADQAVEPEDVISGGNALRRVTGSGFELPPHNASPSGKEATP